MAHSILVSNQIQYIRKAESALRHDLPFCRLLRPQPPSRTSLSHTTSSRHASSTRIGLIDGTVPIETLVSGETFPH